MIAVNIAIGPVRQAWVFKKIDQNDLSKTKLIQKYYLLIFMFLANAIMLFGRIALRVIAPSTYWKYEYILPFVISACMFVLYNFYTEIILFYKKNMILSLSVLVAAITNVALNAICIPKFGAIAACYTTVFSFFMIFVLTGMVSDRCKKNIYSKKYFAIFLGWIILIALIDFSTRHFAFAYYCLYSFSLIGLIIYTIKHKKDLKNIFKQTKD